MLWWMVHQLDAPEFQDDDGRQVAFARDMGSEISRGRCTGRVLVDVWWHEPDRRVAATARGLADGAKRPL